MYRWSNTPHAQHVGGFNGKSLTFAVVCVHSHVLRCCSNSYLGCFPGHRWAGHNLMHRPVFMDAYICANNMQNSVERVFFEIDGNWLCAQSTRLLKQWKDLIIKNQKYLFATRLNMCVHPTEVWATATKCSLIPANLATESCRPKQESRKTCYNMSQYTKTRWSPRTRMPTRMLGNTNLRPTCHNFQRTHLWNTLTWHTEAKIL